ncbi:unnamed protein product [Amoebophrya sp. A120]|nr:unnamed protein product [Amoebophrya sp. A120]|eukprot:GSA120T00018763001.1
MNYRDKFGTVCKPTDGGAIAAQEVDRSFVPRPVKEEKRFTTSNGGGGSSNASCYSGYDDDTRSEVSYNSHSSATSYHSSAWPSSASAMNQQQFAQGAAFRGHGGNNMSTICEDVEEEEIDLFSLKPIDCYGRPIPKTQWDYDGKIEEPEYLMELFTNPQYYELIDHNGWPELRCRLCYAQWSKPTKINGSHTPNSNTHRKGLAYDNLDRFTLETMTPDMIEKSRRRCKNMPLPLRCEEIAEGVNVPKGFKKWGSIRDGLQPGATGHLVAANLQQVQHNPSGGSSVTGASSVTGCNRSSAQGGFSYGTASSYSASATQYSNTHATGRQPLAHQPELHRAPVGSAVPPPTNTFQARATAEQNTPMNVNAAKRIDALQEELKELRNDKDACERALSKEMADHQRTRQECVDLQNELNKQKQKEQAAAAAAQDRGAAPEKHFTPSTILDWLLKKDNYGPSSKAELKDFYDMLKHEALPVLKTAIADKKSSSKARPPVNGETATGNNPAASSASVASSTVATTGSNCSSVTHDRNRGRAAETRALERDNWSTASTAGGGGAGSSSSTYDDWNGNATSWWEEKYAPKQGDRVMTGTGDNEADSNKGANSYGAGASATSSAYSDWGSNTSNYGDDWNSSASSSWYDAAGGSSSSHWGNDESWSSKNWGGSANSAGSGIVKDDKDSSEGSWHKMDDWK